MPPAVHTNRVQSSQSVQLYNEFVAKNGGKRCIRLLLLYHRMMPFTTEVYRMFLMSVRTAVIMYTTAVS